MTFSSSRTFPGQSYSSSRRMASLEMPVDGWVRLLAIFHQEVGGQQGNIVGAVFQVG